MILVQGTFSDLYVRWVYSIDINDTNLLSIFYQQFPDLDKLINNIWLNLDDLNRRALYVLKKIYYLALINNKNDVSMFYFNDSKMETNMILTRGKHRIFYLDVERKSYTGEIDTLRYYLAKDNGNIIYAQRI